MRPTAIVGLVALAMGPVAACAKNTTFACAADVECHGADAQGQCVTGFCAFPDDACDSGQRFGKFSPARIAGHCVPVDEDDGEPHAMSKGSDGLGTTEALDESSSDADTTAGLEAEDATTDATTETGRGIAGECTPVFVDEFDDEWTSPAWQTASVPDSVSHFGNVVGSLLLSIPPDNVGTLALARTLDALEAPALVVGGVVPPTVAGSYGSFELAPDLPRIVLDGSSLHIVDPNDVSIHEVPYDAIEHAWLRISALPDAVHYEASPDATSWARIFSLTDAQTDGDYHIAIGLTVYGAPTSEARLLVDHASACAWST